ncbi:hypothetical protein BCR33DRAFT_149139 [Rhizoclosmatium globosum]|uniref:Uncharacterized protein n=1 Tax=Rhizoclosmatium globosum TaxID=329046 RepID=A0A1Y2AJT5_9FUNG|nr:hypothetical protein BCR33DRAFT_149139 [Rhizoclosmatium globosum]|eukprot:ORY22776.1 hypothetical protein BCR33DRAFT_149139 [Rhizoclosmatium globosum]
MVLIFLNQSLVATHLSGNLSFPQPLRDKYSDALNSIIKLHNPLPQANTRSHANKYPDRVTRSGVIDNSLGFMNGHHMNTLTNLKIREERRKTSDKMTGSLSYLYRTASAAKVVERLNSVLFKESVDRMNRVNELVEEHNNGSLKLLEANGGFLIRYLAVNVFNEEHHDQHDCRKIPSTLLYSGDISKNSNYLCFTDYDIRLPIAAWTIIQMMAWSLNHEVGIVDTFTDKFNNRRVEVFGSYDSLYRNFNKREEQKVCIFKPLYFFITRVLVC